MSKRSLKRRFSLYLGLPVAAAATLLLAASIFYAHKEIQEIYDTQLAQTTEVVASMLQRDIDAQDIKALQYYFKTSPYKYKKYVALRIWSGETLLFSTRNSDDFPTHPFPVGLSDQSIDGNDYRVFVLNNDEAGLRIEALQDERARWDLVRKLIGSILVPVVLFLASLPLLLWGGLKLGLQPLERISQQVARRSSNELEPINDDHIPEEIVPLVDSLNALFLKVKHTIEVERDFTNLAAHELRTPLAVIQTQLDAIILDHNEKSRRQSLPNLNRSVGRATRMIGQLLSLARLGKDHIPFERVMLAQIAREVSQELSPLALQKHITFSYEADDEASIRGNVETVELALRNLIDNAIKYTPAHGSIAIAVVKTPETVRCIVADSGSGIPAEHLSYVTERFYRMPGNRVVGSGLGLSIVRRAAETMNGELILENRRGPSGLLAILQFPNAA